MRPAGRPGGGRFRPGLLAGVIAAVMAVFAFTLPAAAVSATELVEHGSRYDGKPVVYRGEAIGEVMRRGNVAVLNLNDGIYSLGVWVPVRAAAVVTRVGRSSVVGDLVEVRGTFHRACPQHGGDLDLHADSLTVVAAGRVVREPFHRREAWLAVVLSVVALALAGWEQRRARLRRQPDTYE